ncbi:MAG TPA: transcription termination/antitermination NusG family protein [Pyrinomonadaceae bacterium]|nr:transcription termination/antitermination NusG family protein [Pyrinomonadaceae bacterium]
MQYRKPVDNSRWYAVHTHPKQEDRANHNLMAWHVETFSPKIKTRYSNPYTGSPTFVSRPLFPRYIFAHFEAERLLSKVLFTRGVHSVISFGGVPAEIDDEVISFIQSQVAEDGFVRVGEQFKTGDQVIIKDGPFRSLSGVFERQVKGSDRVLILLSTIQYQGSVVVEREQIGRINTPKILLARNSSVGLTSSTGL